MTNKIIFLLMIAAFIGCSKSNSQNVGPAPTKPEPVDKSAVTAFLQLHEKAYGKDFLADFDSLVKKVPENNLKDNKNIKPSIEAALNSTSLSYDSRANTIGHVLKEGKVQCYSGTSLIASVLEEVYSQKDLDARGFVVVTTTIDGVPHVFPGYIQPQENRFRLIGIETTLNGSGITDYGFTDEIKQPVRVVTMNNWIDIEVGSSQKTMTSEKALALMLEVHKKYNIPVPSPSNNSVNSSEINPVSPNPLVFGEKPLPVLQKPRAETPTVFGGQAGPVAGSAAPDEYDIISSNNVNLRFDLLKDISLQLQTASPHFSDRKFKSVISHFPSDLAPLMNCIFTTLKQEILASSAMTPARKFYLIQILENERMNHPDYPQCPGLQSYESSPAFDVTEPTHYKAN